MKATFQIPADILDKYKKFSPEFYLNLVKRGELEIVDGVLRKVKQNRSVLVTVVFPQTFQIDVDPDDSVENRCKKIKDHAAYLMETSPSRPIIQDCDDPELVE